MSRSSSPAVQQIWLEPLHPGQARAYRALIGHRFMALRCGRRFGKTGLAKSWAAQGLLQGEEVGWFAPEHKHMAEAYADLKAREAIKPTLFDYGGTALVCSNSAGKNPDNFFYNLCNDPRYGFVEFHAKTMDNPLLPKCNEGEAEKARRERRARFLEDLKANNDPLVFAQEYCAEFVDWSGVAFFSREKLLVDDQPIPPPSRCDYVFAVIDTAVKTGTDNDGTAVTFFGYDQHAPIPLVILDWDIDQIDGAVLEGWLPSVFSRLEELARLCGARMGSIGAFIEDKSAGMILLQQALRRGMPAQPIDSKLTAVGKDERAMSVSGYVHQGRVKYSAPAFHKTTTYKGHSRNHLLDQVESFRIGAKDSKREDDLTLYDYFDLWSWDGTLDRIHDALYAQCRQAASARRARPPQLSTARASRARKKGACD
jgi:phage terminase large subunit-like protein